jgi:hypothetical protein
MKNEAETGGNGDGPVIFHQKVYKFIFTPANS